MIHEPRPICFTNGVFDCFHEGHRHFLRQCAELSDRGVLVVALNDDASARRLKGSTRPVHTIETRIEAVRSFLETLRPVIKFNVVRFSADTPTDLIHMMAPHVLIKGDDAVRPLAGEEFIVSYGGRIEIVDRLPGVSTTELLARGEGSK